MTMNYEADEQVDGGISEESAEAVAPPELSLADLARELAALRDDVRYTDRRVQSFTDKTTNIMAGLEQRVIALASNGIDAVELHSMLSAVYEQQVDPDVRERKALEQRIAKAEKASQTPPPAPMQQMQPEQPGRHPSWNDWDGGHIPLLVSHAKTRGFSEAEMAAPEWKSRLYAAGLVEYDGRNYSTAWQYDAAIRQAVDNLAVQKRQNTKGRAETPNVTTATGGGRRNYANVPLNEISDEDYDKDFAAIAAAVVERNSRR